MIKVKIIDPYTSVDSGKVFFCDKAIIHEAGNFKFCEIINERAKVKSCQIPLNGSHFVYVEEK